MANVEQYQLKVMKLQLQILQAYTAGNTVEVSRIQRLLVSSLAARVLAVLQVTSASGAKTPGVDGVL